jgi:hypothetical protein
LSSTGINELLEGYRGVSHGHGKKVCSRCFRWSDGSGRWLASRIRIACGSRAGGCTARGREFFSFFLMRDARCKLGRARRVRWVGRRARVRKKLAFCQNYPQIVVFMGLPPYRFLNYMTVGCEGCGDLIYVRNVFNYFRYLSIDYLKSICKNMLVYMPSSNTEVPLFK